MIATIAVLAAVISEAFIGYAASELFSAGYDSHHRSPPWPMWVIVALTAYSLPGLAGYFNLRGKTGVLLPVLAAYLVVYGAMRLEFSGDLRLWDFSWIGKFADNDEATRAIAGPVAITVFIAALLWTRATFRANNEVDLETLPRSLAASFAIATFIVIAGTTTESAGEVGRAVAAFFAIGVLALALSQLAMSGTTFGEMRAGSITGMLLLGITGATLVSVILFGVIFGLLGPVLGPPLGKAIGFVFALILTPPTWLLSKILEALFSNAQLPNITVDGLRGAQETGEAANENRSGWEQFFVFGARTFALLIFLAIVAAPMLLYWTLRKRTARRLDSGPPATGAGSAMEDLRSILGFFGRKERREAGPSTDAVGKLYRDVLAEAEQTGHPREPAQTPAEFAPVLVQQFHAPVTDDITQAFIQARYGGRRLDAREVAELEARWADRRKQQRP